MADDVLLTAAKGIAEIITGSGSVNIDFQDVNTVMEHSGTALMGAGSGKGEKRAIEAITAASTSALLDDSDIRGAKNVLLYFSYSPDHKIKMDEIGEITDFILDRTDGTADVIWGAGVDDSLDDELKVTLIATGFEQKKNESVQRPQRHELEGPDTKPVDLQPVADDEIRIINKPETARGPINIIPFEDDTTAKPEVKVQQPVKEEVDLLVEDIQLVSPEPKAEPKPEFKPSFDFLNKPMEEPVAVMAEPAKPEPVKVATDNSFHSAFENENDVKTAADRIRRIHDLLRNNPNGPDLVQRMSALDSVDEELYEGRHSSSRESATYSMRADGTMVKNAYFGDQPD